MKVLTTGQVPIKAWVEGVPFDANVIQQLTNLANLPFIHKWVAAMPDTHLGYGAAIGSVIATKHAIIPSAVGVDIGCGMKAVKTSLSASDLPDNLRELRIDMESVIPVGFNKHNVQQMPDGIEREYISSGLANRFDDLRRKHSFLDKTHHVAQIGTLGGGNHFIEVCIEPEDNSVWAMLHSGSRGTGNIIGRNFIALAKKEMERFFIQLPDMDLSYLVEDTKHFNDYVEAVNWAQDYARFNRDVMMSMALEALSRHTCSFTFGEVAVNCHHNYVQQENHYKQNVWVTRKGAVSARQGQLGIIPGSMGARSFIVRGLGNPESFNSCSHGAGRVMSRTKAKKVVSLDEHKKAVAGVECRIDRDVIDETPSAYKDLDAVMAAQDDLVEIVHEIKQVLCIKG